MQTDGKILVGGQFTTLGGQSRSGIGRLNADGSLDTSFNPSTNAASVGAPLAVQADGKILVQGYFPALGGQTDYLGRLNAEGSLDTSFHPSANNLVKSLVVQADGKILVGGQFTTLGGESRSGIGRLNADGSLDTSFNPGAIGPAGFENVSSFAMQTDGKILVGGSFTNLSGQPCNCLGRLNADGSLDNSFNPGASILYDVAKVYSLAMQADGKILVGGYFTTLGGQPRTYLGRFNNTSPATQSLALSGSTLTWLRGGTSPEVWRTTFEVSSDGVNWSSLGGGTRVAGGWGLTGVTVPPNASIRARGYATGGHGNGSGWLVETIIQP